TLSIVLCEPSVSRIGLPLWLVARCPLGRPESQIAGTFCFSGRQLCESHSGVLLFSALLLPIFVQGHKRMSEHFDIPAGDSYFSVALEKSIGRRYPQVASVALDVGVYGGARGQDFLRLCEVEVGVGASFVPSSWDKATSVPLVPWDKVLVPAISWD